MNRFSLQAMFVLSMLLIIAASADASTPPENARVPPEKAMVRSDADWALIAKKADKRYGCKALSGLSSGVIQLKEYEARLACHQVWLVSTLLISAPNLGKQGNFSSLEFDPRVAETDILKAEVTVAELFRFSDCRETCVVMLRQATLNGARFISRTQTPRLNFSDAVMNAAVFDKVNLASVQFERTSCKRCQFTGKGTDLSGANFDGATLTGARFENVKLDKARFAGSDLTGVYLESGVAYVPTPSSMVSAMGLHTIEIGDSASDEALALALRDEFKRLGSREALREINYSIRSNRAHYFSDIEYWFNTIFFDLTVGYGLYPARPLIFLALSLPIFALFYLFSMTRTNTSFGVFLVWDKENQNAVAGTVTPQRLTLESPFPGANRALPGNAPKLDRGMLPWMLWQGAQGQTKAIRTHVWGLAPFVAFTGLCVGMLYFFDGLADLAPRYAANHRATVLALFLAAVVASLWMFPNRQMRKAWQMSVWFSLLSGFRFGWRDLSLGTWLALLQAGEYTLKPRGWVRSVAGFQSLLGLFFVGLWAFCYFVGPLE